MKRKKIVALILVLMMIVTLMPLSAQAALVPTDKPDYNANRHNRTDAAIVNVALDVDGSSSVKEGSTVNVTIKTKLDTTQGANIYWNSSPTTKKLTDAVGICIATITLKYDSSKVRPNVTGITKHADGLKLHSDTADNENGENSTLSVVYDTEVPTAPKKSIPNNIAWDFKIPFVVQEGAYVENGTNTATIEVLRDSGQTFTSVTKIVEDGSTTLTDDAADVKSGWGNNDAGLYFTSTDATLTITDESDTPKEPQIPDPEDPDVDPDLVTEQNLASHTYQVVDVENAPYGSVEDAYDYIVIPSKVYDANGEEQSTGFYFGDSVVFYRHASGAAADEFEEIGESVLSYDVAKLPDSAEWTIIPPLESGDPQEADGHAFALSAATLTGKVPTDGDPAFGLLKGELDLDAGDELYIARRESGKSPSPKIKIPATVTAKEDETTKVLQRVVIEETDHYFLQNSSSSTIDFISDDAKPGAKAKPVVVEFGSSLQDALDLMDPAALAGTSVPMLTEKYVINRDSTATINVNLAAGWKSSALYDGTLTMPYNPAGKLSQSFTDVSGKIVDYGQKLPVVNPLASTVVSGKTYQNPAASTKAAYAAQLKAAVYVSVKPKAEDFLLYTYDASKKLKLDISGDTLAHAGSADVIKIYGEDPSGGDKTALSVTTLTKGATDGTYDAGGSDGTGTYTVSDMSEVWVTYTSANGNESAPVQLPVTNLANGAALVKDHSDLEVEVLPDGTWSEVLGELKDGDVTYTISQSDNSGNLTKKEVALTKAQVESWAAASTLEFFTLNSGATTASSQEVFDAAGKTENSQFLITMPIPAYGDYTGTLSGESTNVIEDYAANGKKIRITATVGKSIRLDGSGDGEGEKMIVTVTENKPLGTPDAVTISNASEALKTALEASNAEATFISIQNTKTGAVYTVSGPSNIAAASDPDHVGKFTYTFSIGQVGRSMADVSNGDDLKLVVGVLATGYTNYEASHVTWVIPQEEYTAFKLVQPSPESVIINKTKLTRTGGDDDNPTYDAATIKTYLASDADVKSPQITYGLYKKEHGAPVPDTDTFITNTLPGLGYDAGWTAAADFVPDTKQALTLDPESYASWQSLYSSSDNSAVVLTSESDAVKINVDTAELYKELRPNGSSTDPIFQQYVTIAGTQYGEGPGDKPVATVTANVAPKIVNNAYPADDTLTITDRKEGYENEGIRFNVYVGKAGAGEAIERDYLVHSFLLGSKDGDVTITEAENGQPLKKILNANGGKLYYTVSQEKDSAARLESDLAPISYGAEDYVLWTPQGVFANGNNTITIKRSETVTDDAVDFTNKILPKLPVSVTATAVHLQSNGGDGVEPVTGDLLTITGPVSSWDYDDYVAVTTINRFNPNTNKDYVLRGMLKTATDEDGETVLVDDNGTVVKKVITNANGEMQDVRILVTTESKKTDRRANFTEAFTLKLDESAASTTTLPGDGTSVTVTFNANGKDEANSTSVLARADNVDTVTPGTQSAKANDTRGDDKLTIALGGTWTNAGDYNVIVEYKAQGAVESGGAVSNTGVSTFTLTAPFASATSVTIDPVNNSDKFSGVFPDEPGFITVYLQKSGESKSLPIVLKYDKKDATKEIAADYELTKIHATVGDLTSKADILTAVGYTATEKAYAWMDPAKTVQSDETIDLTKQDEAVAWKLQITSDGEAWTDATSEQETAFYQISSAPEAPVAYRLAAVYNAKTPYANTGEHVAFITIMLYNNEDNPLVLTDGNNDLYNVLITEQPEVWRYNPTWSDAKFREIEARDKQRYSAEYETHLGYVHEELKRRNPELATTIEVLEDQYWDVYGTEEADRIEQAIQDAYMSEGEKYKHDLILYYYLDSYDGWSEDGLVTPGNKKASLREKPVYVSDYIGDKGISSINIDGTVYVNDELAGVGDTHLLSDILGEEHPDNVVVTEQLKLEDGQYEPINQPLYSPYGEELFYGPRGEYMFEDYGDIFTYTFRGGMELYEGDDVPAEQDRVAVTTSNIEPHFTDYESAYMEAGTDAIERLPEEYEIRYTVKVGNAVYTGTRKVKLRYAVGDVNFDLAVNTLDGAAMVKMQYEKQYMFGSKATMAAMKISDPDRYWQLIELQNEVGDLNGDGGGRRLNVNTLDAAQAVRYGYEKTVLPRVRW